MNRLSILTGHLQATALTKSAAPHGVAATNKAAKTVLVTGAAGNIAYVALFLIAKGNMLGDTPIHLRLLDIPPMAKAQEGVAMELRDAASPFLLSVLTTTDYKEAFDGVDICLLIGAMPRGKGMNRADLLQKNAKIFEGQGKAINQYASRNVKVLVVGNPANTNALITAHNAPDIPKANFTAMTRLDQSRAKSMLSQKCGVPTSQIKNVIIWGNHSKTQYPDVRHGSVTDFPQPGMNTPIQSVVNDDAWLQKDFITTVQYRGAAIIKARGKSSAASAASSAIDHVRSWILGTAPGEWVSMGVYSTGEYYGIPKGIMYSVPCITVNGEFKVVTGLKLDEFSRQKMQATAEELLQERSSALGK